MPALLLHLFAHYGYLVIFVAVLLENAGIPAPGHTAILAGAFLAQMDQLSLPWVVAAACVAAVLGDNIGYWAGRRGGQKFLDRHRKLLHMTEARQQGIRQFFARQGAKTVFIARFITGLQTVAAVFAGVSGMHWARFFLFNLAGAVVWSAVYGMLGYFFGASWDVLHQWLGRAGILMLTLFGAGAIFILYRRRGGTIIVWLEQRLPAGVSIRSVSVMALAALALGVFGKIAEDDFHRESTDYDRAASLLVHRMDSPGADALMRLFSAAGSFPTVILVVLTVAAWSFRHQARPAAYVLCAVTATCEGLNSVLKLIFERARPSLFHEIVTLHTYSFPSGHAMAVMAIYGTVAFILAQTWPRARRWISLIAVALILLVGLSRVFLGAHWATDVLAGYAAGAFIMLAGILTLELLASARHATALTGALPDNPN